MSRPHIQVSTATSWDEVTMDWAGGALVPANCGTHVDARAKLVVPNDAVPGTTRRFIVNEGAGVAPFWATMTMTKDPNDESGSYQMTSAQFRFMVTPVAGPPPAGVFTVDPGQAVYVTVSTSKGAKVANSDYEVSVRFELE